MDEEKLSTGIEKSEKPENSKVDISEKSDPANPFSPENLFESLPGIELIWLVSRTSAKVEVDAGGYDELPLGTYLIFRIGYNLSEEEGLFQVERPARVSRDNSNSG